MPGAAGLVLTVAAVSRTDPVRDPCGQILSASSLAERSRPVSGAAMLVALTVRQLAVIESLEVEFGPGLNVVTGETGAGKSILVNALKLVLGARGRPDLVRSGADRAEVEALFHLRDPDRFAEFGVKDGELLVRRTLDTTGRTRASLNGRLATAGQLVELAAGLVDICSQHEHHSLVNPGGHLAYLDAFAGLTGSGATGELGGLKAEMAAAWKVLQQLQEQEATLRAQLEARAQREDLLRFQLAELEKLNPEPGEDQTLADELPRLRHASRLQSGTREAEEQLYAGDGAVCERLGAVLRELGELQAFDTALVPMVSQLEGALSEIEEAARALGRYADRVQTSPERLAEIEERLHQLRRLARKYGSLDGAITHLTTARAELAALDGAEARLDALRLERDRALHRAADVARRLSARRQAEAARLGASITAELGSLGMGDARVVVGVDQPEGKSGELTVGGARLGIDGMDRVEFLIATNRGEDPRPLRKVASGGELSRALLALKRVLAGLGEEGLYVFDEVDSGVGGAVAEVIGRKLYEVSRQHQVLCISHLPQIAAYADQHFHVRKEVVEGRTRSMIHRLTDAERREELARMLGGIRVSDAARAAADELLRQAR